MDVLLSGGDLNIFCPELNNHNICIYVHDFLLRTNMNVLFCPQLNVNNIYILVYDFLQYAFAVLPVL